MQIQPAQAQPRGGMTARTKSQTGIQHNIDGAGIAGLMPSRHNPQPLGNAYRIKLRLGQTHPVVVCQPINAVLRHGGQTQSLHRLLQNRRHILILIEQGADAVMLPNPRRWLTRLTENGLLVGRVRIGIQHIHRQCAQLQQSLAQRFGMLGIGGNGQGQPTHDLFLPRSAKRSSR